MKNNPNEIEITNLEEIINEPLEDILFEKKKKKSIMNVKNSKEYDCLKYTLQCFYLPLFAQVTDQDNFKSVVDPNEILNEIKKSFPEFEDKFEGIWSEITENVNFIDYSLDSIKEQLYWIETDSLPYYNKEDFSNENQYNLWKQERIEIMKNMITKAEKSRKEKNIIVLHIMIKDITLEEEFRNLKLYVKILDKNKIEKNQEYKFVLKKVSDIEIQFYVDKILYHQKIGMILFDLNEIFKRSSIKNSLWGKIQFEDEFQIFTDLDTKKIIGNIQIDVKVLFQKYLLPNFKKKQIKLNNYLDMYEILIYKMIKNFKNEVNIFNFHQEWILNEFSKVYGIGEIFKKLCLLKGIEKRIDLLSTKPFVRELSKSIEFIHFVVNEKLTISTISEIEMFKETILRISDKILNIMNNFIKYFPEYLKNILALLIQSFQLLKCNYEGYTLKSFHFLLEDCIIHSIKEDYLDLKEEMKNEDENLNENSLFLICENLKIRIQMNGYQDLFKDSKFMENSVEIYYQMFKNDLNDFLKSKKVENIKSLKMIELCKSILQINLLIQKLNLKIKISVINPFDIGNIFIENYINEIKNEIETWIENSISIDKFEEISDEYKFSSSVVDIFNSISQVFDHLKTLNFVYDKSLISILYNLGVNYGKKLQNLCVQEMLLNEKANVSKEIIIKINNVHESISQILILRKDILGEEKEEDDYEFTEKEKKYSLKILKDIYEELIIMIVNKIQPNIINILKLTPSKEEIDCSSFILQNLFDNYLTPIISHFSKYMMKNVFKKFLEKLLNSIIKSIEILILQKKKKKFIYNIKQISNSRYYITIFEKYFYGSGQGIEKDVIEKEIQFLYNVIKLNSLNSDKLIELFEDKTMNKEIIISLLERKNDKLSNEFLTKVLKEEVFIKKRNCYDSNLIFGKMYIFSNKLIYEKNLSNSSKIIIEYKDIKEMNKINSILGKGIEFKLNNDKSYKLFNKKPNNRDLTFDEIMKQSKDIKESKEITENSNTLIKRDELLFKYPCIFNQRESNLLLYSNYFMLNTTKYTYQYISNAIKNDTNITILFINEYNLKLSKFKNVNEAHQKIMSFIDPSHQITFELLYQKTFKLTEKLLSNFNSEYLKEPGILFIGTNHISFDPLNKNSKVKTIIQLSDVISFKIKRNFYKSYLIINLKNNDYQFKILKNIKLVSNLLQTLIYTFEDQK